MAYRCDDFDDENEDNIPIIPDDSDESGYESLTSVRSSDTIISIGSDESDEPVINPIILTEEVEMTLIFSFDDICIHLVNNQECDDTLCESSHIFPSREFILNKLIDHTPEQINKAYELVLKSKALKNKYLEVFNGFIILRQ